MTSNDGANFLISLHDGQLENHWWQGGDLVILIAQWNDTPLHLRCKEAVLVKELIGDGDLEGLIECHDSDVLREARQRLTYLRFAASDLEEYRHFRLLDNSYYPVLDVVCKRLIEEEPSCSSPGEGGEAS